MSKPACSTESAQPSSTHAVQTCPNNNRGKRHLNEFRSVQASSLPYNLILTLARAASDGSETAQVMKRFSAGGFADFHATPEVLASITKRQPNPFPVAKSPMSAPTAQQDTRSPRRRADQPAVAPVGSDNSSVQLAQSGAVPGSASYVPQLGPSGITEKLWVFFGRDASFSLR